MLTLVEPVTGKRKVTVNNPMVCNRAPNIESVT